MALLDDIAIGAIEDDPQKKIESIVKQLNEWGRVLSNEDRTNITKDDAGDQRLLIGFQQDGFDNGNVGVKMSQEGVDVQSATSEQLIFSTDFNLFKIVDTGVVNVVKPANESFVSQSVAHQLGYPPLVVAFVDPVGDFIELLQVPYSLVLSAGTSAGKTILFENILSDSSNINFRVTTPNITDGLYGTAFTAIFRYYILQETASTT